MSALRWKNLIMFIWQNVSALCIFWKTFRTTCMSIQLAKGDSDSMKIWKFLQRSMDSFLGGHGVHLSLDNALGTRVFTSDDGESSDEARLKKKKKKKWHVILPLTILLKLTHLKLMVTKVLLGIGVTQLILIVGGALIFHYLKNNTLCKVQPHLVHTHSHVSDYSEPEVSIPNYSHHSPSYGSSHVYSKDWATNRAYSAYSYSDLLKNKE